MLLLMMAACIPKPAVYSILARQVTWEEKNHDEDIKGVPEEKSNINCQIIYSKQHANPFKFFANLKVADKLVF